MMMKLIWLVFLILFVVAELLTMGLTTIWFAGGALVALIVSFISSNAVLQLIVFVVVSVLLLLVTRPLAKKYFSNRIVKTNIDDMVGKKAKVVFTIDNVNATGYVSINGVEWLARSYDDAVKFNEGDLVRVVKVDGVKLIVKAYTATEE